MRIAIYGTGGVGGYFGAQLARAGQDVTFIARGEHLRVIRDQGLYLETPAGEVAIKPAKATDDPAQVGEVDVVLVALKAWQVTAAAHAMRPMIGPNTVVVPLQNGVEAPSQLEAVLGAGHAMCGLCGTISFVIGPGRIRSISTNNFIRFGEPDNRRSERAERLLQAFANTPVKAEIPPDIFKALWEKFLFVSSFGGVGVLTRAPLGVIRTTPETRLLLERCMQEVHAVGRARNVAFADTAVADHMAFLDSLPATATTSLQRDIADGKPSELEAWNGAVVRLGRESSVATPMHEIIYHTALPSERRARGELIFPA
ncbi:MAG: 2-dehydropantoate 2-reductase [Betaproteobacteria bacterium]|jgi:2-dehydropantoate 2-reductase|nr:2-dehydropantoate 2-reductase [Betaproteobacteria bacterium]